MRLPPGRYRAKCIYHTFTVNSAGNPELRLQAMPFSNPPHQILPANYTPAPLTIFLTITPATIGTPESPGWVLETLKHLNFRSADLTRLDPSSDDPYSFTGIEIEILGSEDEYKGKKRTRWNIIRNSDEARPIAQTALQALSQRYAAALATLVPKTQPNPESPF